MENTVKSSPVKNEKSYWIKLAAVIAIQLSFWIIPAPGGITSVGMKIIGIFIGTIIGWCICDPVWPSLVCLIMLGLSGYQKIEDLMASAVSSTTVLNLFFIMVFSGVVLASGFAAWAGQWLISRKLLHGRPLLLSIFIILTMYLLEPFASIATLILLWDVIYTIAEQVDLSKGNKWPKIMVYGTLMVIAVGFYYNFQRTVLSMSGLARSYAPKFTVTGFPFIIYGLIVSVLLVGISVTVIFLIWKPDMGKLKSAVVEPPPPMNDKQKVTFWMTITYVVLQIIPSILPATWEFTKWINQFGTMGTTVVFIILFLIIKVNRKPIVKIKEATNIGVLWGPIYMTASALVLATALTSKETGITKALNAVLTPVFSGLSPFAFGATLIIAAVILTNIMNNLVVAAMLMPILFTSAPKVGANPYAIFMVLLYACFFALLLPSSNPMTAFMFGSKDKIDSKSIMQFSLVTIPIGLVILIFVALPLANLFY